MRIVEDKGIEVEEDHALVFDQLQYTKLRSINCTLLRCERSRIICNRSSDCLHHFCLDAEGVQEIEMEAIDMAVDESDALDVSIIQGTNITQALHQHERCC